MTPLNCLFRTSTELHKVYGEYWTSSPSNEIFNAATFPWININIHLEELPKMLSGFPSIDRTDRFVPKWIRTQSICI